MTTRLAGLRRTIRIVLDGYRAVRFERGGEGAGRHPALGDAAVVDGGIAAGAQHRDSTGE